MIMRMPSFRPPRNPQGVKIQGNRIVKVPQLGQISNKVKTPKFSNKISKSKLTSFSKLKNTL